MLFALLSPQNPPTEPEEESCWEWLCLTFYGSYMFFKCAAKNGAWGFVTNSLRGLAMVPLWGVACLAFAAHDWFVAQPTRL